MSHQNLLAIDIGNSTITFAILQGNKTIKKGSFNTDKSQGYPYYYQTLLKSIGRKSLVIIKNVAISSVVPELDSIFILLCKKLFGVKPFFVNHKNCSLKIRYSNPSQVGADRLANSVAGKELLGCPLIIIDFGTAITFDCVNKRGEYVGGIILPGTGTSLKALHNYTSKLPLVDFNEKPRRLIGKNTEGAMLSGIYYGVIGAITGIIGRLKKTLKCNKIVLTGGYASLFKDAIEKKAVLFPELTLRGIAIIRQKNAS